LKELIAEVQPFVDSLHGDGVDLVVALSHSGAAVGNAASEGKLNVVLKNE